MRPSPKEIDCLALVPGRGRFRKKKLALAASIGAGVAAFLAAGTGTALASSLDRATAAASASCRTSGADAARLAAARASVTPLTPISVRPLPDGGVAYSYSIDGTIATFPVPPPHFDPLHASDALLAEYGFQPRPAADSVAYPAWVETMSSYRSTPVPEIALGPTISRPHPHATGGASPSDGFVQGSWGGWIADWSSTHYVATEMDFTEPSVQSTSCSGSSEAAWTGLGGYNTSRLVQDGVEVPTNGLSLCSSKASGYCAWYEYLNASSNHGPTIMSQVTIHSGDNMHLYSVYSSALGRINFYVADNTTGTSQSVIITGVGTSYYDGTSGDFIGAEPAGGTPLKHFSTFSTRNSHAENTAGTWTTISQAQTPTKATLINLFNGNVLATTGNLNSSGTGFSMTWVRCS
jgi:hypothetical protein